MGASFRLPSGSLITSIANGGAFSGSGFTNPPAPTGGTSGPALPDFGDWATWTANAADEAGAGTTQTTANSPYSPTALSNPSSSSNYDVGDWTNIASLYDVGVTLEYPEYPDYPDIPKDPPKWEDYNITLNRWDDHKAEISSVGKLGADFVMQNWDTSKYGSTVIDTDGRWHFGGVRSYSDAEAKQMYKNAGYDFDASDAEWAKWDADVSSYNAEMEDYNNTVNELNQFYESGIQVAEDEFIQNVRDQVQVKIDSGYDLPAYVDEETGVEYTDGYYAISDAYADAVALDFDENLYNQAKANQLNSIEYQGRTDWTGEQVAEELDKLGMSSLEHAQSYGTLEGTVDNTTGKIAEAYTTDLNLPDGYYENTNPEVPAEGPGQGMWTDPDQTGPNPAVEPEGPTQGALWDDPDTRYYDESKGEGPTSFWDKLTGKKSILGFFGNLVKGTNPLIAAGSSLLGAAFGEFTEWLYSKADEARLNKSLAEYDPGQVEAFHQAYAAYQNGEMLTPEQKDLIADVTMNGAFEEYSPGQLRAYEDALMLAEAGEELTDEQADLLARVTQAMADDNPEAASTIDSYLTHRSPDYDTMFGNEPGAWVKSQQDYATTMDEKQADGDVVVNDDGSVDYLGEEKSLARRQWEDSREDLAPWREAGKKALNTLSTKIKEGPGDYYESDIHKARMQTGNELVSDNNFISPTDRQMKELQDYGKDYSSTGYDNFLTRHYNSLAPLQSLAGVGQSAVHDSANAGNAYAATEGQSMIDKAKQAGSGYINEANRVGLQNVNDVTRSNKMLQDIGMLIAGLSSTQQPGNE